MSVTRILIALFASWAAWTTFADSAPGQQPKKVIAYVEIEGVAEDFVPTRDWASYYWREDFTFLLRDDQGKTHRVISREPTPWTNLRLGTTYPGLKVDWPSKPRVKVIGVRAVDRQPEKYYDLKLDPEKTTTAFILRVQQNNEWKDYYVNNWFHNWSPEADRKLLQFYANESPHYAVFGHLGGIAAPFDKEGKELIKKYEADYSGIIYHGRVKKADNEAGYEVHIVNLMGRHKKTLDYDVFFGKKELIPVLDGRGPKK